MPTALAAEDSAKHEANTASTSGDQNIIAQAATLLISIRDVPAYRDLSHSRLGE
jgi:hypothetical protein